MGPFVRHFVESETGLGTTDGEKRWRGRGGERRGAEERRGEEPLSRHITTSPPPPTRGGPCGTASPWDRQADRPTHRYRERRHRR